MNTAIEKKATHLLVLRFECDDTIPSRKFVQFKIAFIAAFKREHEKQFGLESARVNWQPTEEIGVYYTRSPYATEWIVATTEDAIYQTPHDLGGEFPRRSFRIKFNVLQVTGYDTVGRIPPQ